MYHSECTFCNHVNPAASRFCNACGGPLGLLPCPHCKALNDVTATMCHTCAAALPASSADASAPSTAFTEPSVFSPSPSATQPEQRSRSQTLEQPLSEPNPINLGSQLMNVEAPQAIARVSNTYSSNREFTLAKSRLPWTPPRRFVRHRSGVIAGTVALAAVGVLGSYAYRQFYANDKTAAPAPAVSNESRGRVNGNESISQDSPASRGAPRDPLAAQKRVNVESPEAAAAILLPVVRPQTSDIPREVEKPPPAAICTDVVTALGLCTPETTQRR